MKYFSGLISVVGLLTSVKAFINATQTNTVLTLQISRLFISLEKANGYIANVTFDGVNMLGKAVSTTSAIGPYMDCVCAPSQVNYVPGATANYTLIQGVDSTGVAYGGMVLSQMIPNTGGELLEQFWFLRETETGLHMFTRLAYHNATAPYLADLQALRTLFRPQGTMFTHLSTNADFYVPQPMPDPAAAGTGIATIVQDTTWDLSGRTGDPYVEQVSNYFTKYSLQDTWRDHDVHGLFADGTGTPDNTTFGAWTIMNSKDTYFGGPTYSDLVVDGILCNYIVSNHHGNQTPNITNGFDRTFGPTVFYLNHGPKQGTLHSLRSDAAQYANTAYAHQFYDDIAKHIHNYVTTAGRGTFKAEIILPLGAKNAIAILSQNGVDYQDNVGDTTAYQYWEDIPSNGYVEIDRVKAGTYRLTVYTDGIFRQYTQDNIRVTAGGTIDNVVIWVAESAGTELWRIGTPDKSSGEYKHGNTPDPNHPLHPEYRIY